MELLGALMINPMVLGRWQQMLLLLPLCLAVSVVYKTTKCERVQDIIMTSVVSWITIIIGMYTVGVVLYLIYAFAA